MEQDLDLTATCAGGAEPVVARELRDLGIRKARREAGGVRFRGTWREAYLCCLWLRSAHRLLWELARFPAKDAQELYAGVREIPWEDHLTASTTLAVMAHGATPALRNTLFTALKVKDAVVDRLRDRLGARPDVDLESPDFRISVHLADGECGVSLDLAGESLHRRGYRQSAGPAPLRETLAATVLALGEQVGRLPLVDPMCGAGTIAIEAALRALRRAPGLQRPFGMERWPSHGPELRRLLADLRQEARESELTTPIPPILGSDIDGRALGAARRNARAAGVAGHIRWERKDLRRLRQVDPTSLLVTNPPYGRRISAGGEAETGPYRALGKLIQGLRGGRGLVLAAQRPQERALGLEPSRTWALWNGQLRVRLLRFDRPA